VNRFTGEELAGRRGRPRSLRRPSVRAHRGRAAVQDVGRLPVVRPAGRALLRNARDLARPRDSAKPEAPNAHGGAGFVGVPVSPPRLAAARRASPRFAPEIERSLRCANPNSSNS
jgi:hypothetical protein